MGESNAQERTPWVPSRTTPRPPPSPPPTPPAPTASSSSSSRIPSPKSWPTCSSAWATSRSRATRPRTSRVYRQGDINYILNAEPGSFASRFVAEHGPCAPSMAWRVVHARHAFDHAVKLGAEPYTGADKTLDVPAIKGIGGSLHLFRRQVRRARARPTSASSTGSARAIPSRRASASITSTTSPTTSIAATWTSGSTSMPACSTSARSASSTSRASTPACTRAR